MTTLLDFLSHEGALALITSVASFGAAYGRFRTQIAHMETVQKELVASFGLAGQRIAALEQQYGTLSAGWRLEFDNLKAEFDREIDHRKELEEVRKQMASSHPKEFEGVERILEKHQTQIDKLKERGSMYVRAETFAEFAKEQEFQWRQIAETLGRLKALADQAALERSRQ